MPNPALIAIKGQLYVDLQDGGSTRAAVADNDPLRGAYSTFISGFVPAANPTDILEIAGSATKVVRVRAITVTGTATGITIAQNVTVGTGLTAPNVGLMTYDIHVHGSGAVTVTPIP